MSTKIWTLDLAHSEVHFKIKHLVISTITGSFNIFSGSLTTVTVDHNDFANATFDMLIDVYSIDTNNPDRDEHLKSPDFFNADLYPQMKFHSTSFKHIHGDEYKLTGPLTIKEITKEVTFDVLFGGKAKDGFGINRAGFEITGVINRNDFNIHAPDVTEAGGLVLGEEIKLLANIQFIYDID